MRHVSKTRTVVVKNNAFKKVLFSLAVIAVCSSLQFASCKKGGADFVEVPADQVRVLKDLYKAMNGGSWANTWDTINVDPANWYGVSVEGKVLVGLDLSNNGMTGTIPSGILNRFTTIRELELANNELSGEIPFADIIQLKSLTTLMLYSNSFTGTIPKELAQLTLLTTVNLAYNLLQGPIPTEVKDMTVYKNNSENFTQQRDAQNNTVVTIQ